MEEFFLILLILALAMFVGSVTGFGDSLIFIALTTAIFLDVRIAIVLASFWSIFLSTSNAINYRHYYDKVFLKKQAIPGIIGIVIGSFLLVLSSLRWLEFSLGIFVLIYVMTKLNKIRKEGILKSENFEDFSSLDNNNDKKEISNALFFTGAFSYGFLSGLIGASGPINVVLLERTGHERESFIANFSLASLIISPFKLGIYLWNGLFPVEFLGVFLVGIILIFVLTKIGHWLTPKIPKEKFTFLILILLLIISIRLIVVAIFFY
jgi:uncharacterized membrane protein YfcA